MRMRTMLGAMLGTICLSLVGQPAPAQDNNLARIYFLTPKAGMAAEFEDAIARHAAWRRQNKDPWTWILHEVENGTDLGMFIARSGDHTWADFDAYEAGFGQAGSDNFYATVGPYLESVEALIGAVDTTNANWPEAWNEMNLLSIIIYHVKPGQQEQFFGAVNKIHRAIMQTHYPVYYGFESIINGGVGGRVALVLPYENWADFQAPEQPMPAMLAGVYGEEDARQLFQDFADTYRMTESMVVRIRWDLSVLPNQGM